MLTPKFNNLGIKVSKEISSRASQWDFNYLNTFTANPEPFDPFEATEEQYRSEIHNMYLQALRKILPAIVGETNYSIFYLVTVKKLPYKPVAKIFGIREDNARKKVERVRTKLKELTELMESSDELYEKLDLLAFSILSNTSDYEFNFSESINEYNNNIVNVENDLGIKGGK